MKALTIRAPWWWYIFHGGLARKNIENRSWATQHRGPLLIHAATRFRPAEVQDDLDRAHRIAHRAARRAGLPRPPMPSFEQLQEGCGRLVGQVIVTDCRPLAAIPARSRSPWLEGPFGWMLDDPHAFAAPIPWRGALGLFVVPDHVLCRGPRSDARSALPGEASR